jgi:hypothetical protein
MLNGSSENEVERSGNYSWRIKNLAALPYRPVKLAACSVAYTPVVFQALFVRPR